MPTALGELVLHAGAVEQLVGPLQIGVGRRDIGRFPEVEICRRTQLVFLRDVVSVQISPRARVSAAAHRVVGISQAR